MKTQPLKKTYLKIVNLVALSSMLAITTGCQHQPTIKKATNEPTTHLTTQTSSYQDSAPDIKPHACTDYLEEAHLNQPELSFVECSQTVYNNIPANIARYQVTGENAIQVHKYLKRVSNLPELKKDCCHWSTLYKSSDKIFSADNVGKFRYNDQWYYVVMQSKELQLGWTVSHSINHVQLFDVFVISPIH